MAGDGARFLATLGRVLIWVLACALWCLVSIVVVHASVGGWFVLNLSPRGQMAECHPVLSAENVFVSNPPMHGNVRRSFHDGPISLWSNIQNLLWLYPSRCGSKERRRHINRNIRVHYSTGNSGTWMSRPPRVFECGFLPSFEILDGYASIKPKSQGPSDVDDADLPYDRCTDLPLKMTFSYLHPRALVQYGSLVHLYQLTLKNPRGPESQEGYSESQSDHRNVGPFRFLSWGVPVVAQPINSQEQHFRSVWWVIGIPGVMLWLIGGLVVWRGAHLMDEILYVGLPVVVLGLVLMSGGLYIVHRAFTRLNPWLQTQDSITHKYLKHVRPTDIPEYGDVWTFCAIDSTFSPDSRTACKSLVTLSGLTSMLSNWRSAHLLITRTSLRPMRIDDTSSPERKYSPAEAVSVEKRRVAGLPDMGLTSTSYIEPLNGTTRSHMRLFRIN